MKPMFILNRNEEIVAVLSGNADDSGCHFFNALLTVELNKGASLTFEVDTTESDVVKYVKEENMVIVHDGENHRLLVIKEISDIHGDSSMKEVYCEDASSELIDEIIYNEITGKLEMREALASMLRNTRWQVGEVDNAYIRNLTSDYKLKTVLNGIQTLANDYDAEIDFTVEFAGNKIVSRKVHMKQAFGRTLGKRFEFGKDVTSIKRTVNTADIKTAIVPFGATNEETGEVLTIKDVEWSKPTNPFNKPLGQTYIEDEEATALWGYKGSGQTRRARWIAITFDDCTSANELINYAQLQLNRFNKPKISYEVEVVDLYRMMEDESYSYEKVCLGDLVNIIDHEFVPALALQSRIVKLELDLNDTSNSKVTLGTVVETIVDKDLKTQLEDLNKKVNAVASSIDFSDIEDRLDSLESETGTGKWEQIQEVNNLLFSNAVGYHYMDSSNGIWVFDKPVNEKPTKAVALKGGMIGLAKYDTQKQQWNVGTFIDGTSVNASMINTGTLKADRIEAGALSITHFNKELTNVINSVGTKASKTEVTAAIKTAVDEINLSVSTKYSTKSETSSVVASAKSEAVTSAVNTAKSYADTKKAEAITKAVEDASAYADTKANAVKTALTPLIDGKASKTDVYTKEETYTKGQTDSAIKVAKDEINLGVKNTYETKSNVESKITSASTSTLSSAKSYADTKKNEAINSASADATNKVNSAKNELNNTINNIKVGGRNLLSINNVVNRDSANFTKNKYSVTFTHNSEWQGIQFYNLVDIMELNQTYILQYKVRKTAGSLIGIAHHIDSQFSVINYTVDGVSRSAGTSVTDMGINDSNWHICIMEVKRITNVAGDGTGTTNRIIPQPNRGLTTSVSVEMKDFQIEKGNKATDWTPAPEDVQASIDLKASKTEVYTKSETYTKSQTDSAIKVAKDEINLGVQNKYETKTNVESKISTAKTEVIATSKSYADTKKSEAITQAGKDADSKVAGAKSELIGKIDLKANTTDVYKKSETYTKGETDSRIKVAKDEITLGVSNTYETKSNVESKITSVNKSLSGKIDAIQVGGTNIATETNRGVTGWGWGLQSGGRTISEVTENGIRCCKMVRDNVAATGWSYISYSRIGRNKYVAGRAYTVSFEVKSSVPTSFWCHFLEGNSSNGMHIAGAKATVSEINKWTKLVFTITMKDTLPSSTSQVLYLNSMDSGTGVTYIFRNLMIEEGTKASSWTPSPEDVSASIEAKASKTDVYTKSEVYTKGQTDSAIKVAKDEITLGVSNTYETKSNVESKISTATTSTLTSAKSYADTKKAEAISSASTDATNKVNSAKNELNTAISKKANSTDVYTKSETYTKAQTDSAIKVAKDEINLGVKNSYETKSNVESKITSAVNNVQIGGRNLIKQSKLLTNVTYSGWSILNTGNEGFKKLEIDTTKTDWQECSIPLYTEINTLTNDITISFEYQESTSGVLHFNFGVYNSSGGRIAELSNLEAKTFNVIATKGDWKYVSFTFNPNTLNGKTNANHYRIQFKKVSGKTGRIQVRKPMLEISTKASSWSPAPEDVDSAINSKANASEVYKKSETYTKGETDSRISVAKNEINLGVSNTYETKSNVESKITSAVNNVQVGGRNYALKSDAYITGNNSKQFDLSILQELRGKKVTVSVEVDLNNVKGSRVGFEPSIIFADGSQQYLGIWQSISSATTMKKRISATHTVQDKEIKSYNQRGIYIQGVTSGTARIGRPKLEIGTKATDWTPAPEDVDSAINLKANASEVYTKAQTDSAIKVAKDSITNTVSSTYLNKSDASNTYATKSSLTQTTDKIVADFKSSGGYNLLRNSKGKNGTAYWLNNGGGIRTEADATFDKCFYTQAPSGIKYSEAIRLKNNTEYVYEGYVYSRNAISGNSSTPLHYWCNTTATGSGSPQLSVLDYRQAVTTVNKWTKCYVHFRTASTGNVYFTPFIYVGGSTKFDLWVTELSLSESSIESKWTPHPDEVYNGSTVIDASGVTINNGALTVKNKSGTTVLSGDSNGNLILNGTAKSQSGDMWVGLDSGGITFQDYHKNEQMLRAGISHFSSNRDLNGVTFAMPQCADFIRFSHISKLDLTNGWTSSDTQYHFMDIWSSDQNTGDKDVKKGINVYSPIYMNKGIKLYSGTTTWADISGTMSWSNKYGTVWNILGMYGDNGAVLGYKSGDSLQARFLVSEASHPGTGDNLISWGNYNFNGYTFHNANISANYLTVSGSKNCLQKTNNYGSRLINAYETAEYYFGDLGFGEINADGECFVSLDDIFLECVNTDAQYHVFTQVYEGAIKSIERHKTYFIVKGEPNTSFSWELKAKRIGYENNRLDVQEIDTSALETGLELFTDDDYKVNTSEEALLSTLTFDLNEILLTEE